MQKGGAKAEESEEHSMRNAEGDTDGIIYIGVLWSISISFH
jgi:hypothetical protein